MKELYLSVLWPPGYENVLRKILWAQKSHNIYIKNHFLLLSPELRERNLTCFSLLAAVTAWCLGCSSVAVGQSDRQENEECLFPLLVLHKDLGLVCLYAGRVAVSKLYGRFPAPVLTLQKMVNVLQKEIIWKLEFICSTLTNRQINRKWKNVMEMQL